jgi:hypothetical protein
MPIYDYALLALLTGGHGPEPVTLTLGPDAIVQPKGGAVKIAELIKLGEIKGESADHKHKDTIHIESLKQGNNSKPNQDKAQIKLQQNHKLK